MSLQDGATWTKGTVDWSHGGWLTVWVEGLSAEANPGNTIVEVGKPLGIVVHDHLVIGREGHASFRGLGLI